MGHYQKIEKGGGKMPRKLKKRIKKMPIGSYCYGSAIGAKGRMINGKKVWTTICCPYFHGMKKLSKDGEHQCHCSFLNKTDDFLLTDQVKICGDYAGFFPEFKNYKKQDNDWMKKKPEGMGAIAWLWEKEKEERRNKIKEKEQLKERRRLNKIIRESKVKR